jgi:ubiquinone/menaquinone biosynthesis C-methylase UbiE
MTFSTPGASHQHSLQTLQQLYEYDDFMASISSLIDLGCGSGEDLEWWATRTTRDETPIPLNIQCTGIDFYKQNPIKKSYDNITYRSQDFEDPIDAPEEGFDILWCHDAFQYAQNPLQTLARWWHMASAGAMLYICVPITQRMHRRQFDYYLNSGCYYHYSLVSMIHLLATTGWDCRAGFFKQNPTDSWIHAVVYKSQHQPMNPKTTTWYQLAELELVPDSAARSIHARGHINQQDLVLPWLDHSLMSMAIK